jgi:hypothetical protein
MNELGSERDEVDFRRVEHVGTVDVRFVQEASVGSMDVANRMVGRSVGWHDKGVAWVDAEVVEVVGQEEDITLPKHNKKYYIIEFESSYSSD